jgi:NMD protein affecting ribosome stability and mRNA decay
MEEETHLKSTKHGGSSGDKETKAGKNSNSGHCPHCGKRHRGECRFKPSGTKDTSSSTNNNNQYKFNKPQQQYINQLVEAVVKKTKHDSNVVESDEDKGWSKGMTPSEHMYVLSAAQSEQHTDKMDIEIDVDDLKDFRRRFKAVRKKIKKQLYSK